MLHESLVNPKSIVIVGGSDNLSSPGGKVLKNLIHHNFKGDLFVVNPKKDKVQGIASYKDISKVPNVDCAIIAVAAKFVLNAVTVLSEQKGTKGFIIYSAGFSELNEQGEKLEKEIVNQINKHGGCLLGPNNIGLINSNYTGVFTTPIPELDTKGVDLISGSGATAVFIIEASKSIGLTFSSVYTLGNSAQIGVEDVLQYLDETFDANRSSKVKLLYIESIKDPIKFLNHAKSLVLKGCKIAAIKAGSSEAGNRAASSHTGALASSDVFADSLFKKAGIIRCFSKNELVHIAGIMLIKEPKGKNIAIVTHAGGPAVMLTDVLSKKGLVVPQLGDHHKNTLLGQLFNGASANNPIDFLATGTAEQLDWIIDYCDNEIVEIDAVVVIFGSPGLVNVDEAYKVINQKAKNSHKPIYAVLPSVINAKNEIEAFISKKNIAFTDEVLFGNALAKVINSKIPLAEEECVEIKKKNEIRKLIEASQPGYLSPHITKKILGLAEIPFVDEYYASSKKELNELLANIIFPVAMKVVGPLHKSDVGGVVLSVQNKDELFNNFNRLIQIEDAESVIIQPMRNGLEVFVGAKKETNFPHIVMC